MAKRVTEAAFRQATEAHERWGPRPPCPECDQTKVLFGAGAHPTPDLVTWCTADSAEAPPQDLAESWFGAPMPDRQILQRRWEAAGGRGSLL